MTETLLASDQTWVTSTSSSDGDYKVAPPAKAQGVFATQAKAIKSAAGSASAVERAVYAHIQAMRSLGRTSINTADIAKALSLSRAQVERAAANLRERGVKSHR